MFGPISAIAFSIAYAAAQPAATGAQPEASEPPGTIVVTGPSRDLRRALEECLARNCPVNEDVDASAALAESLFLEGEYADAHRVIRQSLGRNRGEAARFPEPVSDLYRASSRLARHRGRDNEAIRATHQTLHALREGLPTEDHRHFSVRLEIAHMLLAFGKYNDAQGELRELGELARAAGREDVVAVTVLRRIWIDYLRDAGGTALRRLAALAAGADRGLAIGARLLLVRIYGERGDTARADALMAELSRMAQRRQLLYAPPYELNQREDAAATTARAMQIFSGEVGPMLTGNHQERLVDNFDDQWIDVAFWVTGDGRVEDLEIARRGSRGGWEGPLLQSIRGRRYTADSAGERTYRLERYTYTSELRPAGNTATRVAQRSPRARVEYMDLSTGGPGTN